MNNLFSFTADWKITKSFTKLAVKPHKNSASEDGMYFKKYKINTKKKRLEKKIF